MVDDERRRGRETQTAVQGGNDRNGAISARSPWSVRATAEGARPGVGSRWPRAECGVAFLTFRQIAIIIIRANPLAGSRMYETVTTTSDEQGPAGGQRHPMRHCATTTYARRPPDLFRQEQGLDDNELNVKLLPIRKEDVAA